ncbi:hypothetical protein [Paraburkholderia caribensis]|uniref:hypothetical protein n=1 Tax=Paraburkholderia caribensis TaxID=75105 RepID=UPI001D08A269|nr:hypothetical protein [Paraburkholderia caribensis]
MRVFDAPSIEIQPLVFLTRWQVMEVNGQSRHFIGNNTEMNTGRASTRIVHFDAETRRGVTGSGRIYELVGDSGVDAQANFLWTVTCAMHGATSVDVSSEYDQARIASQRPVAPFVAQLFHEGGPGNLSVNIPATGQSFEAQDPEELARLLFVSGVRQGYLQPMNIDGIEDQSSFVVLVREIERQLNRLERGLLRGVDGAHSAEC